MKTAPSRPPAGRRDPPPGCVRLYPEKRGRTARADFDGQVVTPNAFGYNLRSEVTSAAMGTRTYTYDYDPIGNWLTASADAITNLYAANALNQCTNILCASASLRLDYDPDGNLLTNGPWAYTWDAENRLASACSNSVLLVTNVYDHQSRRIRKEVYVRESPSFEFQVSRSHAFLHDGWNVIREVRSQNSGVSTNYYTWGLDLSGSLQGAGGVGGLLAVTTVGPNSLQPKVYFPAFDANGNVAQYLDATGGVAAACTYDAFGNTVACSGPMAGEFTYWFSTKYLDAETGLYYDCYHFYSAVLGRWVSRYPLGGNGGVNNYCAFKNAAVNKYDLFGLYDTVLSPLVVADAVSQIYEAKLTTEDDAVYCDLGNHMSLLGTVHAQVAIDASETDSIPEIRFNVIRTPENPDSQLPGQPDPSHMSYLHVRFSLRIEAINQHVLQKCCKCQKTNLAWRQWKRSSAGGQWSEDKQRGHYFYAKGSYFDDNPGGNAYAVDDRFPASLPEDREFKVELLCGSLENDQSASGHREKVLKTIHWQVKWSHKGGHKAALYWGGGDE